MRKIFLIRNRLLLSLLLLTAFNHSFAQTNQLFDGKRWNISTGNLSVSYIYQSPIGPGAQTNFFEAPPSIESQVRLKNLGLVWNEDYIAWGAVERAPGQWLWKQHDDMEKNLHAAGLRYTVYDWVHFPPTWLRDQQKDKRTLMRCLEHGQETYYLSVFDPRTIEWYDNFYKNLHEHFGDKIDEIYACILGPYGEGNYPLRVDWVTTSHIHEGYWCGDEFATKAFQAAMKKQYSSISRLNKAWDTDYKSLEDVIPPTEIAASGFVPSPILYSTAQAKRRWLDFITWYHQAIIDFAEQSFKTVAKYFPNKTIRMKPGGNARGVNPLSWGTYCPGYARMARKYKMVLQPADCMGAVFGDKWMGTAYQFYGVTECTEPPGDLDDKTFVRRMFSDASCGASQFFSYQFEHHAPNIQKYVHLITGKPGDTDIALYCPTTLYRLGASLKPTIDSAWPLRDLCEFDVLDELLIADGALTTKRYKTLLMFQGEIVDQPILDKMEKFLRAGGRIICVGNFEIKNVEGKLWSSSPRVSHVAALAKDREWLKQLSAKLDSNRGVDGKLDGLWTCRRGKEVFILNPTDKVAETTIDGAGMKLEPHSIWSKPN